MVRVLLDEDIDGEFRNHRRERACGDGPVPRLERAQERELLRAAEAEYDALVTMDDKMTAVQTINTADVAHVQQQMYLEAPASRARFSLRSHSYWVGTAELI